MQQLVIFIGNQLFLKLCALCGVGCLTPVKQLTPHSAHSLPPESPTSKQLQQDRKPEAVKRSLTS